MVAGFLSQNGFYPDQRGVPATGTAIVGVGYNRAFLVRDFSTAISQIVYRDMRLGAPGIYSPSYFDDYYYRVYIRPLIIDFKSVTSEVVEQIVVWNAWPDRSSVLNDIVVENDSDITVTPEAPVAFTPTSVKTFDLRAETSGPADINAIVRFTFSTEEEDIAIRVIGNRVTSFAIPAEVPVSETWKWFTDEMNSVNGAEQTASLSGGEHRVTIEYDVQLMNEDEVLTFKNLLLTGIGKVFTPEWQNSAIITSGVQAGSQELSFDKRRCDVRPGEFAMITDEKESAIVQISDLTSSGARLMQPISVVFDPLHAKIVPGATGIIGDSTIQRDAINEYGKVKISANLQRYRSDLRRPQDTTDLERYLGMPVLNRRAYVNGTVDDTFVQDLVTLDNGFGVFDTRQDISFARVKGTRRFFIDRVKNPSDMDFWKAFGSAVRGSAKPFLLRSYRPDLRIVGGLLGGLFSATIEGVDYAQKTWPKFPTHRILRVENAAGEHVFLTVSDARVDDSGLNSLVSFDTALPVGYSDTRVAEVCLPVRIEGDVMKWQHSSVNSEVEFTFRSTLIDGV